VSLDRTFRSALGEEEETVVRLAPPVALDGSGRALVVGGTPPAVAVFEDFIVHRGGELRSVEAAPDRGLVFGTRTSMVGKAVVAAARWTPASRAVWAAAVWTRAPGEFGPPESKILLFDPTSGDLLPVGAVREPASRWPAPKVEGVAPRRPDRPTEVP
jgi:hypothetical protein